MSEPALGLLAVFALVLANGFFVAAEFSLVAVRQSRIEQLVNEGNRLAPTVQRALKQLDAYLAATQLGITMASLGLGWVAEPALASIIDPLLAWLPSSSVPLGTHAISAGLSFAIITALHIVLGELAPKSLALQRTESTALAVSKPLELFATLLRPAVWVLNGAGNLVIKAIGLKPATNESNAHSAQELRYLVTISRNAGELDAVESEMIARAFCFGETRTHSIMVPRTEMVAVEAETPIASALDCIAQTGFSRLPVYEGDYDHMVGVVHLRDIVRYQRQGHDLNRPVRQLMRDPLVVPRSSSVESVLGEMRRRRTHLAIVIDEHGGTAGLVTMEDLLEEIVGDVQDEFEPPHQAVHQERDGSFLIDGLVTIEEFNEQFPVKLRPGDYDTVGGFIMAELGRIPAKGDEVVIERMRLLVDAMDGKRVATVRVTLREPKDASGQAA